MALFTGTRIGADGKRYPSDSDDIPDNADEERPKLVPVFGQPAAGEVPVWNADKARLEWAAGGEGGGGGGDGLDAETEARLEAIELKNTDQDTALEGFTGQLESIDTALVEASGLAGRVDDLEDTRVVSATVINLEKITQAEYDDLDPPDEATLYIIVAPSA